VMLEKKASVKYKSLGRRVFSLRRPCEATDILASRTLRVNENRGNKSIKVALLTPFGSP
jgi:hypothetical protein